MDLRALLRPVGPLPAGVYWRRRLAVLAVLAVVAVLLGMVAGGGDDRAGASGRPTAAGGGATHPAKPAGTPSGRPHPGTTAAGHRTGAAAAGTSRPAPAPARHRRSAVAECTAGELAASVSTDRTSYHAGEEPRFLLSIVSTAKHRCRADVGTAARSVTVRSGSDRIWSSADCTPASHTTVVFDPGERLAYAVTWSRHRSAPGCVGTATAALPGTYRAAATLGARTSPEAVFVIVS